ncbi:MAG: hypothetical protein V1921_08105 [Candidatus Altiarchaeota archaeon]
MNKQKTTKREWTIIGALIGGVWGLTNFFTYPINSNNLVLDYTFGFPIRASAVIRRMTSIHPDSILSLFIIPAVVGIVVGVGIGSIFQRFYRNE